MSFFFFFSKWLLSHFREKAFSLCLCLSSLSYPRVCNYIPLLHSERQHQAGPNEQIQGQHHRHESHRQQPPAEHPASAQHLHQPTQAPLQQHPWWVTPSHRSTLWRRIEENRSHLTPSLQASTHLPAAQNNLVVFFTSSHCGCQVKEWWDFGLDDFHVLSQIQWFILFYERHSNSIEKQQKTKK